MEISLILSWIPKNNKHKIKNNIESMIKGIPYITHQHIKKERIILNKGIII